MGDSHGARPRVRPEVIGTRRVGSRARTASNLLRVDWLFSYHPTPGTVVYLGYGNSLEEPSAFRFRSLTRLSDGFFAKVSYLFHV